METQNWNVGLLAGVLSSACQASIVAGIPLCAIVFVYNYNLISFMLLRDVCKDPLSTDPVDTPRDVTSVNMYKH
jgi:hypothetical protein